MVRAWGESGTIQSSGGSAAKDLLFPFFNKLTILSGISIADTADNGFFLLPDGSMRQPMEEGQYKSSERPWFAPALNEDGCYWTPVYRFHTLGKMGITASVAWSGGGVGEQTVGAFDILIDDFFTEVQTMAPTPGGRAFVLMPDGKLFVPGSEAEQAEFRSIDLVADELSRRVLSIWKDEEIWQDQDAWHDGELKVLKTRMDGTAWWCGFMPLENSRRMAWMGVMVPQSDIEDDIALRRSLWISSGVGAFLLFSVPYGILSRRKLRNLAPEAEIDVDSIRTLISRGENQSVEFKSTVRMNLHTKKPGKEIELAWLKGVAAFLNCDGGTLLLGVTDAGEITGLEQDVFENDDKCRLHFKNLIATHLGAELSKYIRFELLPLDGKTIGAVLCARASEPVFLKDGNKEYFYIRNGPSSDELPVSKALNYIKRRK
jgi:hypothetical protein